MVAVSALALVFAFSYAAQGKGKGKKKGKASISVHVKPHSLKPSEKYTLTIKGKAKAGTLSATHNRSEVDRFEQLGGSCAATTPAEGSKPGITDLGPVFVKAGKFKIKQLRLASPTKHTTIRFCVYLYHGINKLDARSTAAYKTK